MSRADWSFLEHLLEEGQEYSTAIGRIWLTVLFLFRMLVLGTAAESAWDDEQAGFVCNTKQPGCTAVCYDRAFPISHFRYFVLQVIFVSTPTIFYFGYVAIRERKGNKNEEDGGGIKGGETVLEKYNHATKDNAEEKAKEKRGGIDRKPNKASPDVPKLKGCLLVAYTFSILLKVLLEGGFIVGLWFLYNGFFIKAKYECTISPCPHTVDCFVSRPTEKTIFTIYTQAIAAISLLLNLIELIHLIMLAISQQLEKRSRAQHYLPRFEQVLARQETPELQTEVSHAYSAGSHITLPMQGEAELHTNPCETQNDTAIEVNWEPAETGGDLLPSYVNCLGAMRKTNSPRSHHKKHSYHNGKNPKAPTKLKHYV
ncbi:gap junction protein alpha 4 [Melanotaenia boesemani]|uniref:gap junction protein alpha 4 n=1 Tax=Melanotaenia boesemani TaxID=1250792 RepID=UPI001C058FF5|nr:gap junction protein alpha 4 [Melanotaenia boesemani]XP_041823328.1 gap junction protein alpha 4 [Melanotaenia boesemani]